MEKTASPDWNDVLAFLRERILALFREVAMPRRTASAARTSTSPTRALWCKLAAQWSMRRTFSAPHGGASAPVRGTHVVRGRVALVVVHVTYAMPVCWPNLVPPTFFVYKFLAGLWSHRCRLRHPWQWHADMAHLDELD
jgi:hypothetical protein